MKATSELREFVVREVGEPQERLQFFDYSREMGKCM
jgi:hypothetical protein